MARIAATRARSTFPQRRPAGCCLRSGAGWPGWRGSECSRWKLLPSEVIDHVCGRLGGPAPSGALQEQQHQGASFFCACWAGWRCQLPPTFGGLVALRPSWASGGGLMHCQQRRAAQDCMPWPRTLGGAACSPSSCPQRGRLMPNITLMRCQHEPNMAASLTCAANKSHLCTPMRRAGRSAT